MIRPTKGQSSGCDVSHCNRGRFDWTTISSLPDHKMVIKMHFLGTKRNIHIGQMAMAINVNINWPRLANSVGNQVTLIAIAPLTNVSIGYCTFWVERWL